jgi:hypothetical protein
MIRRVPSAFAPAEDIELAAVEMRPARLAASAQALRES